MYARVDPLSPEGRMEIVTQAEVRRVTKGHQAKGREVRTYGRELIGKLGQGISVTTRWMILRWH
jgi:hypothetical protein